MSAPKQASEPVQLPLPGFEQARAEWRRDYEAHMGGDDEVRNRSGIEVKPLYGPEDWDSGRYMAALGFPGQPPMTRGIYPSMHRGQTWSQRQIVGFGVPEDFRARHRAVSASGATGLYLAPCNSYMRGYDADEVEPALLGTCGTVVNTREDFDICLADVDVAETSMSLGCNPPFTLTAMTLAKARREGVPWASLSGTTNQSDYISHFVANHMFFRIALPGSRRLLTDLIAFATEHMPRWSPCSVVGQHMQQAGATPAEAMALALATAVQYSEDCVARGLDPDSFLPRFSFFFDISLSFFEEVAKFRAGRRVWARLARERFGAKDPRSWRFKFHSQTSGVDLTRQQPLNNIGRVAVQAMAGIFGGTQSLHTDAHDEALSSPTEAAALIAVNTQNILREEAHLTDVIDPLGGAYYVEALTDQMEAEIEALIARIDAAGGMFAAVEQGLVQRLIGASAQAFQEQVERGEQTVVGVNAYQIDEDASARAPQERPDPEIMANHIARLQAFKASRDQAAVEAALDDLAAAAHSEDRNVFAAVIEAVDVGASHGEVCARLRREMGFGQPLVVA
jgi:methylmalonyl-CoA mutase N-terminal domain/subunit